MFRKWGISAAKSWNMSGEPCSGAAIDSTDIENTPGFNPAIKCNCDYKNGTTCHITELKVYALDVKGVIPEELANLTYLTYLKLDQNYLTGPMPAFLGNLSAMQKLSFGINALSGNIPAELGKLTELRLLAFGSNNFSGTLPPQIGNLVKLEEIYMDSSGVSGEIPWTFRNLVNMKTMWASDNNFIGKLPEFIGNWKRLKELRFQGNSFEGPIPSSYSKLTSLIDLILRNNMISGTIPSNIGEYQNLQRLDLSFNNLSGHIPSSLFNLSSLYYLFLGNNSLSGSLPPQKSEKLLNIDLSYNELSGSFPSWVSQDLQLNLVANNFIFDNSNSSLLSPGLDCLQRNFPCNRGFPHCANFSVKCGGQAMASPTGRIFESENETLAPASYYVTDTKKWGVSNVGLFNDRKAPSYFQNTLSQIAGTGILTTEFFQTSRLSPGSLRYCGLGLENGIYTVSLWFAETKISDASSESWRSLGRRVFDIYIQRDLQLKDFDIRKEAGGASNKAVQKEFKANVSENFIEIHLFWAGKGTCCIPEQGYYGPSISALAVTSDFTPTVSGLPPTTTTSEGKTELIVGLVVGVTVASLLAVIVFYLKRKRSSASEVEEEFIALVSKPNTFSYTELKNATHDFDPKNKLGEGGFGPVYKGVLLDGRLVAVKQLSVASHQGRSQFVTEVATLSAVQQRNLVKLYGCCIEGNNCLLVYEYLENKSLDQALFRNTLNLDWHTRYNICLGAARGLAYLHEESRPRIVHRDLKASNILLDADLNPKISDFGLAKLYDDKKTHISTRVAGTIGYLAPEYALRGHLTEKADVFGYGIVVLEIVSGRPNFYSDPEKIYLLELAWNLHENNCELELIDPKLSEFDEKEACRLIRLALLCTQVSPALRPSMSRVVAMLLGDVEVSTIASRPDYLTNWELNDISSRFMGENSLRNLGVKIDY
ncbi:PREDICTED: probable LRR receptor-like serine/threonine-protein kinase At1g56140 isoform X3 [Nelumbo nucifera]|uniref:non-specific serine/threonine protein kinase n=1 Tax=Nelumbo nucifera TaxID=4432 RepID=A0A1U7YVG5_NELNU|nr:PREDICTED: probable LRR receptor-like serine/threonine-protein kinase At1g56140 isoform X3 [Nelumbo nucifera]